MLRKISRTFRCISPLIHIIYILILCICFLCIFFVKSKFIKLILHILLVYYGIPFIQILVIVIFASLMFFQVNLAIWLFVYLFIFYVFYRIVCVYPASVLSLRFGWRSGLFVFELIHFLLVFVFSLEVKFKTSLFWNYFGLLCFRWNYSFYHLSSSLPGVCYGFCICHWRNTMFLSFPKL